MAAVHESGTLGRSDPNSRFAEEHPTEVPVLKTEVVDVVDVAAVDVDAVAVVSGVHVKRVVVVVGVGRMSVEHILVVRRMTGEVGVGCNGMIVQANGQTAKTKWTFLHA